MNGPKMGWDTGWKPGIQSIPAIAPGYKKQTYPKGAVISVSEKLYVSNTAIGTPEDFNKDHWDETDVMSCISDVSGDILDDGSTSETVVVAVPLSQADDYTVGDYYKIQNRVAELRTKTVGDEVCQLTFDTKRGVLEAINDAVSEIGKPLKLIGSATVSELNGTITGLEPGWTYTLTDSGTLTAGTVEVEAGDEVAWSASGTWVKIGGETCSTVVIVFNDTTYPDGDLVYAAVQKHRDVVLFQRTQYNSYVYRLAYYGGQGNNRSYRFECQRIGAGLRLVTTNGSTWTWSEYRVNSITNGGALTDAATVDVPNNALSTLATAQASLTLNVNLDGGDVPNFAVEVTPSTDVTLTVTNTVGNTTTALSPSVSAGNELAAGKKYQVTCVGSCWTLAEFTVPTP